MDVGNKRWDNFGKADDTDDGDSKSSIGSISEDSSMDSLTVMSLSSSSLSEQSTEGAPEYSTTSSSSSSSSSGPLYELSQLMNSLPIKRGLSMFYEGKARSFTSLATVESIGDLPKKETAYNCRKRMKSSSKSYAGDLDRSRSCPKAIISKKSSRRSLGSALSNRNEKGRETGLFRGSFLGDSRLSFSVHKNF
ncbi:hypothetical protein K1719_000101 [Acacia pycnantha]|nr:hypothetical protein K1719_000101 [Acacia pycnantha]